MVIKMKSKEIIIETYTKLVLEIFESGQFDIEKLITHVYPHDQFIEAIQKANDAKEALKVVIEYK